MTYSIQRDEDSRKRWTLTIKHDGHFAAYSYEGSEADAYKEFYYILKNNYGISVVLAQHKTFIPVKHEDPETGEVKRHMVPKTTHSITDQSKPKARLIKKQKE